MAKIVLTVGVDIPGTVAESIDIMSDRSLLDADIIVFQPGIPSFYGSDTYLGKRCLDDDDSFRVREALAHWRRELSAAIDAGKIVVLLLSAPETVYLATGKKEYSGTGRNARATRIVEPINSYNAVPTNWEYHPASGSEMVLEPDARFLVPLWREFEDYFEYRLYLEGEIKKPLVRTRSGNRITGAMLRKETGAFIAIPALNFDYPHFTETRSESGRDVEYWSEEGQRFGKRIVSSLIALSEVLRQDTTVTPSPEWVRENQYRMKTEATIEAEITTISTKLIELEDQQRGLKEKLGSAGLLRRLLYEQGAPLEAIVLEALQILGFVASRFKEGDSEFDAVFESPEGRFIGEVEGKDNKAINIDKFSQLERNLNEDFARDGVSEFAKGVLFGNAYRLKPLSERDSPFTAKCETAAARLGVALVHTPDLFQPCRHILECGDGDYAKACREAILAARGSLVVFPSPPGSASSTDVAAPVPPVAT